MTLQIIGFPRSNFVRTVRMAAHEKGIDYDYDPALPHSDKVKAIHPFGLIPVLRHGALELAESQAIVRYLDSAFEGPKLIPDEPAAAARVGQWMSIANSAVDQLFIRRYVVEYAFHKDDDGNVVRDEIDKAVPRFPRMFGKLENALAGGYFGSAAFSAADCFLVPILAAVQNFPEGKEHLEASDAVRSYFSTIAERPSFKATAP